MCSLARTICQLSEYSICEWNGSIGIPYIWNGNLSFLIIRISTNFKPVRSVEIEWLRSNIKRVTRLRRFDTASDQLAAFLSSCTTESHYRRHVGRQLRQLNHYYRRVTWNTIGIVFSLASEINNGMLFNRMNIIQRDAAVAKMIGILFHFTGRHCWQTIGILFANYCYAILSNFGMLQYRRAMTHLKYLHASLVFRGRHFPREKVHRSICLRQCTLISLSFVWDTFRVIYFISIDVSPISRGGIISIYGINHEKYPRGVLTHARIPLQSLQIVVNGQMSPPLSVLCFLFINFFSAILNNETKRNGKYSQANVSISCYQ